MHARDNDRFFIITGGPGAGKTTLIEALQKSGLKTMPEGGRAIIQHQVVIGGNALPWADRELFAELMLSWEVRSYSEAQLIPGPVLFDRAVPDVVGYRRLCSLPVPTHCEAAVATLRYASRVFIAPPWPEIFGPDAERKQDFAEAEATYRVIFDVYSNLGYDLIELPRVPVSDRVRFVCDRIDTNA